MKNNKTCHLLFFFLFFLLLSPPSIHPFDKPQFRLPGSSLLSSSFLFQLEPGVLYSLDGIYSRSIRLPVKLIHEFQTLTDHPSSIPLLAH